MSTLKYQLIKVNKRNKQITFKVFNQEKKNKKNDIKNLSENLFLNIFPFL